MPAILFSLLLVSLPTAWLSAGYNSFVEACKENKVALTKSQPLLTTKGVRINEGGQVVGLAAKELLKEGVLQCVEYYADVVPNNKGYIGGVRLYEDNIENWRYFNVMDTSSSECAKYYIESYISNHKPTLLHAYHKEHITEVKKLDGDELISELREQIWGGSIVSFYRKLYSKRKTGHLACGYLLDFPHERRDAPNNYVNYIESDKIFIMNALNKGADEF